ncbi:hypothetical protein BY996DRAFT_6418066 [Phakopsora pachyrhizi]|nr:hypothetical protein BY996DRAFT_6418066 [Phakopsora pachyrhizi]
MTRKREDECSGSNGLEERLSRRQWIKTQSKEGTDLALQLDVGIAVAITSATNREPIYTGKQQVSTRLQSGLNPLNLPESGSLALGTNSEYNVKQAWENWIRR